MLNGTRLFTFRKVPVYAHWSATLIVVLVALNLSADAGPVIGLVAAFALLLSILLHEFGHALTASHYGVPTQRITLWGLGGVAQLGGESPTPRAEGWIAAAGPLTSLAIGALGIGSAFALLGMGLVELHTLPFDVLLWLGGMNVLLAVFNILPGAPLDGGRIISAWRWSRHGDRYRAREEAAQAGQVLGWVIVAAGVWLMLRGWATIVLPFLGLFIAMNALAERKAAHAAQRIAGLRVQDLTWYGIAEAPADTDAETMWWQRARLGSAGVVAVTDADGHATGMVTEERIAKLSEQARPLTRLAQLMVPFNALAQAGEQESLITALSRVHPVAPIITVWREGRLVGVVPVARLRERLRDL
jgi:Zn-dependent protease